MNRIIFLLLVVLLTPLYNSFGQSGTEMLPYGNLDNWYVREIKESAVIGGQSKYLYEIGNLKDTIKGDRPFRLKNVPWGTSNVYAKVNHVSSGNSTVFPERRGSGYCARLETNIVSVKALGLIHINVMAAGSIFLGKMMEPITSTKDPMGKLVAGISFTQSPKYLEFDYKLATGGASKIVNGSGSGKVTGNRDKAEVQILLQSRWEDANGNVHAKRIGTGWVRLGANQSTWRNNFRVPIYYGNITNFANYQPFMNLLKGNEAYYALNSKGRLVPILEDGWGAPTDHPTHMIIRFASSYGGNHFEGAIGSKFWIDNIRLVY